MIKYWRDGLRLNRLPPGAPLPIPPHSPGFTLIELITVIAILGIIGIVAGLSMNTAAPNVSQDPSLAQIAQLRDSALKTGQVLTKVIQTDERRGIATAYPDGSVLTDIGDIERTTGKPRER